MKLSHLRSFLCVAEELHFGRAAARLEIAQPALSQLIRGLEAEIGTKLFERTSRQVRLTPAGRMFLPEARRALRQTELAIATARRAASGETGTLGLGFSGSALFVPAIGQALHGFRQDYPEVKLALRQLGGADQIAGVQRGELDIGILRGFSPPALPTGLVHRRLLEEEMLLAVREDHPLASAPQDPCIADLAGEPLVLYDMASGTGFAEHLFILCKAAGFTPRVDHAVDGLAPLLGLVAAGLGATIISRSMARVHVDTLVYRPLRDAVTSNLWLVHAETLSPTGAAFMAALGGLC